MELTHTVAPARERGLKCLCLYRTLQKSRRSREGAWIEMNVRLKKPLRPSVAPARERGLKSSWLALACNLISRSSEGAWIEIIKNRPADISLW